MPFTDVEIHELPEPQQHSQNSSNPKLDAFLDKLIDNPVARGLSQFVKLCYSNNKLFVRSFLNYAATKTALSCTGCMPQNSFEIDGQNCLFTNSKDPLIKDDELLNMTIATLAANIAFTAVFACARMAILKREGRDIFDDMPTINVANLRGEEVVARETQIQMFDFTPAFSGSIAVFFFSLNNNKNWPIHLGNLFLNIASTCFYCDKFLTLPKEQFMAIIENKPPEPSIMPQSPDLQAFQDFISRGARVGTSSLGDRNRLQEQSPEPRAQASLVFLEQARQQNQPRL